MITLDHFEILDDYAHYKPVGEVTLHQAASLVCRSIRFARERGIGKLLVDITALTGFEPPSIFERFRYAEDFAREARAVVTTFALVMRPEQIDPGGFGVTVARNRGLFAGAFRDAPTALAWLLDPQRT